MDRMKATIAEIVRRAIFKITWSHDPFSIVKVEAVEEKPLETFIVVKMAKGTRKFIVQVRELL